MEVYTSNTKILYERDKESYELKETLWKRDKRIIELEKEFEPNGDELDRELVMFSLSYELEEARKKKLWRKAQKILES
jgi:hypothetical protein